MKLPQDIRDLTESILDFYEPDDWEGEHSEEECSWRDRIASDRALDPKETSVTLALITEALEYFRDHNSDRNDKVTRVLRNPKGDLYCGVCSYVLPAIHPTPSMSHPDMLVLECPICGYELHMQGNPDMIEVR